MTRGRMAAATLFGVATAGAAIAFAAAPAGAQDARVEELLAEVRDTIIRLREHIHQYPELGNREFKTAELVANHLRALGFEVRPGSRTESCAAAAPPRGGGADMDALPVTEFTPYPFRSTGAPPTWARGHDIHVAVQLGVASVLAGMRASCRGVKFIFQPAEEGPPPGEDGGARMMVAEGVLQDPAPSAIFGLHSFAEMEVGKVGFTSGPALAAVDHVSAFWGCSHGAAPHLGIDPIVMASQAVSAFQTIRSATCPRSSPAW